MPLVTPSALTALFLAISTMCLEQPKLQDHNVQLITQQKHIQLVNNQDTEAKLLSSKTKNLDPQVVKLALTAYKNAVKQGLTKQQVLTIVDYSKPSSEPRLWVIDLKTQRVLFNELVAHGKASGGNYAVSFSNAPSSNKSSLGTYITEATYNGKHGYSLKLAGVDKGFNDKVKSRAVVMHSAEYVSDQVVKETGRLGRSEGCLALNPAVTKPVIDTIKNGTVIFAYYPNPELLSESKFLIQ